MNAAPSMHAAFASALMNSAQLPTGLRGDVDAARRFGVHRNNVMVALVDALASSFPVTRALVGAEFFAEMARGYVLIDPPRSPILAMHGDGFADFIAGHAPAAGLPWLADVARLEYLRVQAFNAADADALGHAQWQALLGEPARLAMTRVQLQPACRWLSSAHPVLSIWQAHQHDDEQRDRALSSLDLDSGENVLVHRLQWDVRQDALPEGGIAWLDALRAGETLGEALQHTQIRHPLASPDLLFALLLQHGLVTATPFEQDH